MNRSILHGCVLTVFATLATAACVPASRGDDAGPELPAQTLPAIELGDEARPPESSRYRCTGGHSVTVLRELAQVQLADGRVVDIPRVANTLPAHYAGEAIAFRVTHGGGVLSQDEAGEFACHVH